MPRETLRFSPAYVRRAKALITHARSVRSAARADPVDAGALRILCYHRVGNEHDPLTVRVRRFRLQMNALAERGFRVLDVRTAWRRLTAHREAGAQTGERLIGLTFDDGYEDVAENALPVLEELGFSATVFVVTGAVDGHTQLTWYDRQPALLDWTEIEDLDANSPLSFEPHSRTHRNLIALPDDVLRAELSGSKATLESHVGRPARVFSYPGGLFGDRERRLVADAGFEVAVTCHPGTNNAGSDRLALNRTMVERSDHMLDFLAKIRGGHDAELPLRAPYLRLRYGRVHRSRDRAPAPDLIGRFQS